MQIFTQVTITHFNLAGIASISLTYGDKPRCCSVFDNVYRIMFFYMFRGIEFRGIFLIFFEAQYIFFIDESFPG